MKGKTQGLLNEVIDFRKAKGTAYTDYNEKIFWHCCSIKYFLQEALQIFDQNFLKNASVLPKKH